MESKKEENANKILDILCSPSSLKFGEILSNPTPGEEIVITGLAGVYPESENVYHLKENLFNKIDMVNDDPRRWLAPNDETPQRIGKIINVKKWDAGFFGVHLHQAHCTDPMTRLLLEKSFEAILDAGINPEELHGSRTGIFLGSCFYELEKYWIFKNGLPNKFVMTESPRYIAGQKLAYYFRLSANNVFNADTACSSACYGLDLAYRAIREGTCDTAIVGGSNLCLDWIISRQFAWLGVLSKDGKCKVFDEKADGYARSESVVVIILQKAKNSRRIYCRLIHSKTNSDGFKDEGITYPSGMLQEILMRQFYREAKIDPSMVNYIEAHGTGTTVGDPEEAKGIEEIFCKNRKSPLLIGSIKSSIGHCEPSSGLNSLTKVILSMETGFIPPNIYFDTPKKEIKGLINGKMKVVTEKEPLLGGLVGISCFGFGGANAHFLVEWNKKIKNNVLQNSNELPRIVNLSGRTVGALKKLFMDITSRPIDNEYIRLFHSIHTHDIPGHNYRGYALLSEDNKETHLSYYAGQPKKLIAVFVGLEKGWARIGKTLLKFPLFYEFLKGPSEILKSYSFDLLNLFNSGCEESDLDSIVSYVVVQIGIIYIFRTLNIKLDYFVGISYGEIVAAFADGIISAEEAILIAFKLGETSQEITRRHSLYLGRNINFLQEHVYSGEIKKIWEYKENCLIMCNKANINLGNFLKKNDFVLLDDLISFWTAQNEINLFDRIKKNKILFNKKGLNCTSRWLRIEAEREFSLDEYLILSLIKFPKLKNLISHFTESTCVIELSQTEILIKLTDNIDIFNFGRENKKNESFLNLLGKLFEIGAQPKLDLLYPTIEFPVSRGTPMISPLIKWDYQNDFFSTYYFDERLGEMLFNIHISNNDDKYFEGHRIDGRNLFPATGYLYIVWNCLKIHFSKTLLDFPIIFEDVRFIRATSIPNNAPLNLVVAFHLKSGLFEIYENSNLVSSGRAKIPKSTELDFVKFTTTNNNIESTDKFIIKDDIYRELRIRGYHYDGLFKGIINISLENGRGFLEWRDNWVAFIDNLLQPLILIEKGRGLFVPTTLEKVVIDPLKHLEKLKKCQIIDENEIKYISVPVKISENLKIIQAGGVEIRGFDFSGIQRKKTVAIPVLEKYLFIPFEIKTSSYDWKIYLRIITHLMLENLNGYNIKILEFFPDFENEETNMPDILSDEIKTIIEDLPLYQAKMKVIGVKDPEKEAEKLKNNIPLYSHRNFSLEKDFNIIICNNLIGNSEEIIKMSEHLDEHGMILLREKANISFENLSRCKMIANYIIKDEMLIILKKNKQQFYEVINFKSDSFEWISEAKVSIAKASKENQGVIFVSENENFSGILGFFNCIIREYSTLSMQCFLINDSKAPKFNINIPFYKEQIIKNIQINILSNGVWGSYRHLPLEKIEMIQAPSAYVDTTVKGDLSSLKWIETDLDPKNWTPKSSSEKFIQVHYSSLNFRDIMYASGKLANPFAKKSDRSLSEQGFEFSGKTLEGKRVYGIIKRNALATYIKTENIVMFDVPDQWTLEDAATVPVIYATCIYSLIVKGNMKAGESVLIHSATGGVGQAAIHLALHAGCRVFATCAPHKAKYLLDLFPSLDPNDIGNSRDCSFCDMVISRTNGRGVDLVLNSLAEEKLRAGLGCLAQGGRFLEIGKYDLSINNPLFVEFLNKGASFHCIMLDNFLDYNRTEEIRRFLTKYILEGAIKPIRRTVFSKDEQETAFRYMASGKHLGKVLIQIRSEHDPVEPKLVSCIPRFLAKENKSYIIIGGLGGIGLELAHWLIIRGAYKIVLNSRSGVTTGYQVSKIDIWRKEFNVTVIISQDDITNQKGVEVLLKKANELGPVGGIFNLAVNLKDNLFENQTEESFIAALSPKALATKWLDLASRKLCPLLEHFVIFSSVSCGRGNISQTNYGLANSVMERIIEKRVCEGFPGLAIQWGAVGDVGLVAKMQGNNQNFSIGGTLLQSISSCLATLDTFLNQFSPIVSSMVVAEKVTYDTSSPIKFVANKLSVQDLKSISHHVTLAELGMDSMMGVEIIQGLEREFQIYLTAKELRRMTFAKLNEYNKPPKQDETNGKSSINSDGFYFINLIETLNIELIKEIKIQLSSMKTKGNPIFLIPGIESIATLYSNLAKFLNAPVYCLQTLCCSFDTYEEITKNLLPIITKHVEDSALQEIFFVAHSIGTTIAFELVKKLELLGYRCRLIFIDGSPDFIYELANTSIYYANQKLGLINDVNNGIDSILLDRILEIISNQSDSAYRERLYHHLINITSWGERFEFLKETMKDNQIEINLDELENYIEGIHKLFLLACNNKLILPDDRELLSSKIALVRPKQLTLKFSEDDYGLQKYFKNQVKIHFISGDHKSMIDSEELAKIINEFLECS